MMAFRTLTRPAQWAVKRSMTGFSFAGPKHLEDVIKLDMVAEKSTSELADLWYEFHEAKEGVVGMVSKGHEGKTVIERARDCPFFIQPVFRDDGFFMLMSQYMDPSHFCLAYLEDYKMDPNRATPLLTFSVFNDLADSKQIALIRCDILNRSIRDDEGQKIVSSLLQTYTNDYDTIRTFNLNPQHFDIDDYISRMSAQWKQADGGMASAINGE